jgi:hypothetical protein
MALETACGTITITTGAVGTTFTVASLPFQPKALFFSWAGVPSVTLGEGGHRFGNGIAVSTSSRRAYATHSRAAADPTDTHANWFNDCCIAAITDAGALDGKVDLNAINSDGFQLIVDDQFVTALAIGWIAWGGADLTNAEIVDITEPAATGDQDITTSFALNTGIDDKAVIFLGAPIDVAGTVSAGSRVSIGFAAGDTPANAVLAGDSTNAQATTATMSYCRSGECLAELVTDAVGSRAAVSAWLSNGFRLAWAEVNATDAPNWSALVLKGGRWEVGNFLTSTGTSNTDEATTYIPKSLLLISANRAEDSADTTTAHQETCVGVAVDASNRWYSYVRDKDASGAADPYRALQTNAMYGNASNATTQAIEGLCDLVDMVPASGNGFTWVMDDADPAQAFVAYLVGASTPITNRTLSVESGSFAYTGIAAILLRGLLATAAVGGFTETGTAAELRHNYRIDAETSASAVTAYGFTADAGSFALTGTEATFLHFQGETVFAVDPGAFVLNGDASASFVDRQITAATRSVAFTGTAATLQYGAAKALAVASGSFSFSGTDAAWKLGRLVPAQSGSHALSGTAADLRTTRTLAPESGAFTFTGTAVEMGRRLIAEVGACTLTGTDAGLLIGRRLYAESGNFGGGAEASPLRWFARGYGIGYYE